MKGQIDADDLLPETLKKLKLGATNVQPKLIALGKVLQCLDGLTTREALWVVRTATNLLKGFTKRGTRA